MMERGYYWVRSIRKGRDHGEEVAFITSNGNVYIPGYDYAFPLEEYEVISRAVHSTCMICGKQSVNTFCLVCEYKYPAAVENAKDKYMNDNSSHGGRKK